ncbi:cytoplasmic protein [Salmonella enterica]|uniref:Cytoplasmic protein n=1 Tax=Salmonella enterica subsp. enterica serovar Weltevreden TaxID=57743 RepID=A0A6D2BDP3_SALET|nr:cytoplasmic protein [Salmonella enterica]ECD2370055.1 cytoplasmic protein [Salmonella enterica subsp. enterica serovar Weltevreden]ECG5905210.1 cytoplasmic protein [Salmonella enterica subsp. enterica serovar Weltevreden]EDI1356075.1 cytoplasmic protein [Salmonella enterica]EFT1848273.1 cytoplasmic protein [Salmonella enterica]
MFIRRFTDKKLSTYIRTSQPAYYDYDIDEKYKTVRERMAAYNALPQALGAIPCLEYYIARASNMQEAKAQWAADIKARYHNYLDNY